MLAISCKKDYTCHCKNLHMGATQEIDQYSYYKATKKNAKEKCNEEENQKNIELHEKYPAEFYPNAKNYKVKCAIKTD